MRDRSVDHEPEEDFAEFYRRAADGCLRAVYASCGDPALAEELTQDGPDGPQLDAQVLAALRALPRRQREVVALRVFLDLDTETAARTLGIAPGTVTAHLCRATAALRTSLAPLIEQEKV